MEPLNFADKVSENRFPSSQLKNHSYSIYAAARSVEHSFFTKQVKEDPQWTA